MELTSLRKEASDKLRSWVEEVYKELIMPYTHICLLHEYEKDSEFYILIEFVHPEISVIGKYIYNCITEEWFEDIYLKIKESNRGFEYEQNEN